jgi:predicted small secreted protein
MMKKRERRPHRSTSMGTMITLTAFPTDARSARRRLVSRAATVFTAFVLLLAPLLLPACNTTEGFGEDMEEAGEAVQDAADD